MSELTEVSFEGFEDYMIGVMYVPEIEPVSVNFQNADYDSPLLLTNCTGYMIKYALLISLVLLLPVTKLKIIRRLRPSLP